jgi:hypothetical protein
MIRIHYYNMTIVITPTCPPALAEAVIRSLDTRPPRYVEQDTEYEIRPYIPRYSKFIGQLGGKSR